MARENNEKVSDLFGIEDSYTKFCLEELCLYLYNMRGELTYIEKIIKQNEGFIKLSDKVKN